MVPDVNTILERLNRTRGDLLAVVEPIPPDRWRKQPPAGGWSAAEVIAHLIMVEQAILDGAGRGLAKDPRPVPLWRRIHIPPILAEWRFPKVRTPIPLDPALLEEKQPMLDRFAAQRRLTLAFIEANRDRDLSRWRHTHPFFGSLNLYTWFKTIYHHEIRHTKQLRQIAGSV
ncbi:MAG: DinB family protein [Candidatus Acidiferrales bacterium]